MLIEDLINRPELDDVDNEFQIVIKEGLNLETNQKSEIDWLKVLAAFANSSGGNLYVGVEDKSHKIVALDHKEADSVILMVHRLIKEHIEPNITYKISKIDVPNT